MKADISKAQLEVWEWKEALYREIKEIPHGQRLKYLREKVRVTVERIWSKSGQAKT